MLLTILTKISTESFSKSFCDLNIFYFYFINFNFSNIPNNLQVLLYKTFIFIQANIYVKTYKSIKISRCYQDKTMVCDGLCLIISNEIFIILIWRNLSMFNSFFISKWKRIKSTLFVKYNVILIWSFKNNHFKMIVYFSL